MFKWLKDKAEKAAARQCGFNIKLGTKTLISIANKVDAKIQASGTSHEPDAKQVNSTQVRLLEDIKLGIMNGMTTEEIRSIITDICDAESLSDGAQMAIDHVLSYMDKFANS